MIKNSKAGRKMAVLRLNLDKDKDLEELRIYLGGSKSKRTKPARVFDKKELITRLFSFSISFYLTINI